MTNTDTIILCAGKINYSNLPIKANTSNSMIPVNGKPVISWILDDLIEKGVRGRIIIVVRDEDELIQEFVSRVYSSRLQILIVNLTESKSILHSLKAGLKTVDTEGVVIILGDTLIKDNLENKTDFVYVQEVEDSSRWCLAILDPASNVSFYIDKQPNIPKPHYALCGYYAFSDSKFLLHQLDETLRSNKRQMADLLLLYQVKYPMRAAFAEVWYDFGNSDNFITAKQRLLQGRFFNTLTIDPVLHTITKVSELDKKLRNELDWYEKLPDKLKVLTPRIVGKEEKEGKLYLTQEYYGYPTLSELFLYSNLTVESWESIFGTLLKIHFKFRDYSGQLDVSKAIDIYKTKTFERLQKVSEINGTWQALLKADEIIVNERKYPGLPRFSRLIAQRIEQLIATMHACIIHGDYCFSNILYDINSHIVRLIDPRGSFGQDGIYGDPRYDMAKLRHSVGGKYDYIVSDLFSLEEDGNNFKFEVFSRADAETLVSKLDDKLIAAGYNLEEIKFIEALLFLSMIPYHMDKPKRQKAMFLTGIIRLSEIQ